MNCAPYEPRSVRSERYWSNLSEKTGIHQTILRKAKLDLFVWEASRFADMLLKEDLVANEPELFETGMSIEELDAKLEKSRAAAREHDDVDLMHYKLKQLVEVGDQFLNDETKTFLSGGEYLTAGKFYLIKTVSDSSDGVPTEFSFTSTCNMAKETNWGSSLGIKSLWRGGKEVWNWYTAYFENYAANHPETPADKLEELRVHCAEKAAALVATAIESPL